MKKTIFTVALLAVAVLAFGVVGFAYAQDPQPPAPEYPYAPGHMRGFGHGMMGYYQEGPMHETMVEALAKELGLTVEEIEERHDAGEMLWEIAEAEGLSAEAVSELMNEAHNAALEQAVAKGLLSPEQAEWMQGRMQGVWSANGEYGGFGGHCGGRGRFNRSPGWGGMSY
jgi:hypothetical protein